MTPASAWTRRLVTLVGFALLAVVGFVYLVSGLVVPFPWLLGLWALWLALAVYAVQHRREPWHVLATPVVAFLIWLAILTVGDVFLGWTA